MAQVEGRAWHHASVRELPGVLVTAGRLLLAHWPAFLSLAFLGMALRNGAIWLAVVLSNWNGLVAQVLLVAAPLGYLLPIIAMLHLSRRSLGDPTLTGTAGSARGLLGVATAVLIPFLTVYVANGLLDTDRDEYLNAAAFDEFDRGFRGADATFDYSSRLGYYPLLVVLSVVAVAFVVRWALGRFQERRPFLGLAIVAALVDVYWTGIVARYGDYAQVQVTNWLDRRQAAHLVEKSYEDAVASLGSFGDPVAAVVEWLLGLVGAVDAVVLVPLAWLTVAAIVLGHRLTPPPSTRHPWLDRIRLLPRPVRVALEKATEELRERWSAFWQGLRMLGTAGLLPMLAFSLVFLLALRAGWFVGELVRLVVGPTSTETYLAYEPWEVAASTALSMVAIGALLAAAAHWLVRAAQARPAAGTPSPEDAPTPA